MRSPRTSTSNATSGRGLIRCDSTAGRGGLKKYRPLLSVKANEMLVELSGQFRRGDRTFERSATANRNTNLDERFGMTATTNLTNITISGVR